MSNSHLFLKAGFINTNLQNGVGRYVGQLQRVVLKFCKNNGSSRGMREFIETELIDYAKNNPGVVVYLKPRRHRTPVITADFLNGDSQWINCHNMQMEEVHKWLNLLKTQNGDRTALRLRKLIQTDNPSIQGPWTPYTFKDPQENLIEFPNKELGQPKFIAKTATDELLELAQKNVGEPEAKRAE